MTVFQVFTNCQYTCVFLLQIIFPAFQCHAVIRLLMITLRGGLYSLQASRLLIVGRLRPVSILLNIDAISVERLSSLLFYNYVYTDAYDTIALAFRMDHEPLLSNTPMQNLSPDYKANLSHVRRRRIYYLTTI